MFDSPLDPADGGAELHSELHEAVPAFSDDEDTEDFEPRIITDPNLKPKVDLQENITSANENYKSYHILMKDRKTLVRNSSHIDHYFGRLSQEKET